MPAARRWLASWRPLLQSWLFVGVSVLPAVARAHGLPPLPLALWGPFGRPTAECLRRLDAAAQRCFRAVFDAHVQCMNEQLAGGSCNQPQRDALIATQQRMAERAVDTACLGGQLTELRFAGFDDAKGDMLRACAEADTALRMVYVPFFAPPSAGGMRTAERRCVTKASSTSMAYLSFVLQAKSRVLNRIGFTVLRPSEKLGFLSQAQRRITSARRKLAGRLQDACPEFRRIYHLEPSAFLTALDRRADCVIGHVHYQTSVACPLPICGDAIPEGGEECDDGNQIDQDSCRNCMRAN